MRNRILASFERASIEPDPAKRRTILSFVIVGGGPTGVEYAGALAELILGPLQRDFSGWGASEARVVLLEAGTTLLPGFPERLCAYAAARLRRMGVDVRLGARVSEIQARAVLLDSGECLSTRTALWTAGVEGDPLAARFGLPVGGDGRVAVLPTLQLPNRPEVFVVGDLCGPVGEANALPMTAPVAIQQGLRAALNIRRMARAKQPRRFRYYDMGTMAAIGRGAAVARMGKHAFTGFPAWLLWLFVHLLYLVGFRNRIIVFFTWAVDYFLFERSVRLILPRDAPRVPAAGTTPPHSPGVPSPAPNPPSSPSPSTEVQAGAPVDGRP